MTRLKRYAVLLLLVKSLNEKGSWCGETHIQKSTYFLQELLGVPLGFEFILYKYGPFSFDLSDELTAMRADKVVDIESRLPYGPGVVPGPRSSLLERLFPKTLGKYRSRVEFVASELAGYGVSELERIATALYVRVECARMGNSNFNYRTERIHELKPHIAKKEARDALQKERMISKRAKQLVRIP